MTGTPASDADDEDYRTFRCAGTHSHGPLVEPSQDASAAEQLLPLVYQELRKLAAEKLAREKPGQTQQTTALVHDAYLRLVSERCIRGVFVRLIT